MVTPVPPLLRRRAFWLYAIAACAVLLALCAVTAFAVYEAPIWSDDTKAQGLYGAWIQSVGTIIAGALAIVGGGLAYRGAIRAAEIGLDAAKLELTAARQAEAEMQEYLAQALATEISGDLAQLYRDIEYPGTLVTILRDKTHRIASPVEWSMQRNPLFDIQIERLRPIGVELIKAREALRHKLDILDIIYKQAYQTAVVVHDPLARLMSASALETVHAETLEATFYVDAIINPHLVRRDMPKSGQKPRL